MNVSDRRGNLLGQCKNTAREDKGKENKERQRKRDRKETRGL
jgi:hypothetical protein